MIGSELIESRLKLTPRQSQVLAHRLNNQTIEYTAAMMCLPEDSVCNYLNRLIAWFKVRTEAELLHLVKQRCLS